MEDQLLFALFIYFQTKFNVAVTPLHKYFCSIKKCVNEEIGMAWIRTAQIEICSRL